MEGPNGFAVTRHDHRAQVFLQNSQEVQPRDHMKGRLQQFRGQECARGGSETE